MMEIIRVDDEDLQEIEGSRHRTFQAVSDSLTAQVILNDIQKHQRRRVIVICNTVSQAQGLFRDLEALNDAGELLITLLHSRFLPEHRAEKEKRIQGKTEENIKGEFAENWEDDGNCHVLISTQVIEAGINITCEVMHTQLCPMNSLLQRAGRCARFRGERGQVYVYRTIEIEQKNAELAESDFEIEEVNSGFESSQFEPNQEKDFSKKKQKFLPYQDELCERTWQVLEAHTESESVNQAVGFRTEEAWINQVHQDEDALQTERRHTNRAEFERSFNDAVFQGKQEEASKLIRLVENRSLFVWEEPAFIDFDNEPIEPRKLLAFSVPVSTLCKVLREFSSLEYKTDWIFKRIENPKGKASETYSQPVCLPIKSRDALISSLRILVNPCYVYYDQEIGLLMGLEIEGNQFFSPNKLKPAYKSEYQYHMDTYVGHLGCMWRCWRESFSTQILKNGQVIQVEYSSVRDELLQAGGQFIKTKVFPNAEPAEAAALFEILVFFAIFTHDLGKLQVKWQQVMRGWQTIAYTTFKGKNPKSHLLAHTDYDPTDEMTKDAEGRTQKQALNVYEKRNKRPNHAIESAFLSREILKQSLIPLLRDHFEADSEQIQWICQVVMMTAGRHHSAWAKGWEMADVAKVGKIVLHPEAQRVIAASWRRLSRFLPKTLPIAEANLSKTVYPVTREFDLNRLQPDQTEYQQLYSLLVRALRLCDGRSVQ